MISLSLLSCSFFNQQFMQQQSLEITNNNETSTLNFPSNNSSSSSNWSDIVLQNITGLIYVLSSNGTILYCSDSCIELAGYRPNELIGTSLTDYIHVNDLDTFIQNFQYAFNSLTRVKIHYRLRCKNGTYLLLECIGQPKTDLPDQSSPYFFAISQPYLSRSNGILDSYTEIKMEYEWFKERVYGLLSQQQQHMIYQEECLYQRPNNTSNNNNTTSPPFQYYMPPSPQHQQSASSTNISARSHSLDETSSNWKLHEYTPSSVRTSTTNERNSNNNTRHYVLPILNDTSIRDKWKKRVMYQLVIRNSVSISLLIMTL